MLRFDGYGFGLLRTGLARFVRRARRELSPRLVAVAVAVAVAQPRPSRRRDEVVCGVGRHVLERLLVRFERLRFGFECLRLWFERLWFGFECLRLRFERLWLGFECL
ncbi:MAG TPA: hypothetical protein VGB74_01500 [Actinoplanes sp.]